MSAQDEKRVMVVEQLDTAGLVRVELEIDGPSYFLTPREAHDLGDLLVETATDLEAG